MNLQQQERFYQFMNRVKANENERSRAASTPPEKESETVTEVMNGLIVTRPAKKIEHLSTQEQEQQPRPQAKVWNLTKDGPVLQQESKAGSVFVQENKLREILRFQRSNGRV